MVLNAGKELHRISQVEELLETAEGVLKVDLLNELAALVLQGNRERSENISFQALQLSEASGYLSGRAAALFGLGEVARLNGDYHHSLENYSSALAAFGSSGDPIQVGRCYRRLGDVQFYVNNLSLSLKHYLSALSIFEDAAENNGSSVAKLNCGHLMATIGNVLKDSGDLESSLDYYNRCQSIYMREGFTVGMPGILYNIGDIFQCQGSMDQALGMFSRALEEAEQTEDNYLASLALSSIGSVYMARDDLEIAAAHFKKSIVLAEKLGRKRGILSVTLKLTQLNRMQGDLKQALAFSRTGEKLAAELEDKKDLADIFRERALIYKGMRKYKLAFETSLAFQALREKFLSEKRIHELDILRIRYETEAKELEIGRLKSERTVQRRMTTGALTGLLFAGVSLVLAIRNVRFRIKANRELASAYSQAEKLSQIDSLTGLANRRAMMESLNSEQARSARTGRSFSLIMADIDKFKQVNDRYGHACGDEVLVKISKKLQEAFRKQDMISRWGGEEFLILLPETFHQDAVRVAEKTRVFMAETPVLWKGRSLSITLTFGVSEGGGIPVDDAVRMADKALYKGKRNGRNRVEFQLTNTTG